MSRLARSFMLLVLVGVSFVAYATANTITSFTFKFQPNQLAIGISPVPEPGMLPVLGAAMAWPAAAKMRRRVAA